MPDDTLIALSQRPEAFWIGLALLLGGGLVPDGILFEGHELGWLLMTLGGLIITVRLLVGIFRILRNTVLAGWIGYTEGKSGR